MDTHGVSEFHVMSETLRARDVETIVRDAEGTRPHDRLRDIPQAASVAGAAPMEPVRRLSKVSKGAALLDEVGAGIQGWNRRGDEQDGANVWPAGGTGDEGRWSHVV
jgi:hypothetical protein